MSQSSDLDPSIRSSPPPPGRSKSKDRGSRLASLYPKARITYEQEIAEYKRLEAELAAFPDDSAHLAKAAERIDDAERSNAKLKQQIVELKQAVHDLQDQKDALQKANEKQQGEVDSLKTANAAAGEYKEQLEGKIERLERQIDQLESETEALTDQNASLARRVETDADKDKKRDVARLVREYARINEYKTELIMRLCGAMKASGVEYSQIYREETLKYEQEEQKAQEENRLADQQLREEREEREEQERLRRQFSQEL